MWAIWAKKSLSRAAAKGILAPDMMVPLRVTRMLVAMATETSAAPQPPVTKAMAVTAGRCGGDLGGGEDVLDCRIGGHV